MRPLKSVSSYLIPTPLALLEFLTVDRLCSHIELSLWPCFSGLKVDFTMLWKIVSSYRPKNGISLHLAMLLNPHEIYLILNGMVLILPVQLILEKTVT